MKVIPFPSPRRKRPVWRRVAVIAVLLIILALFAGYGVLPVARRLFIQTTIVRQGAYEISGPATGQIIREEAIARAPLPGAVTELVDDGARVPAGAVVCEINNVIAQKDLSLRRRQVSGQLSEVEAELAKLPDEDETTAVIDEQLAHLKQELEEALVLDDGERTEELKERIARLEAAREKKRSSVAHSRQQLIEELQHLSQELEELAGEMAETTTVLKAPRAGVVVFADGLKEVATGQVVFRVVDNLNFQIKTELPANMGWKIGQRGHLMIGDTEVPVTAKQVTDAGPNQEVVFGAERVFPGALRADQVEMTVVKRRFTGQIVPHSALVKRGNTPGVYLMEQGEVPVFCPVKVYGGDQELVVDGIPPGTKVVVNPHLLK